MENNLTIKNITKETRRPITDSMREEFEGVWDKFTVERGYGYFESDLFDLPNKPSSAKHIERLDDMDVFDSDMDAALYGEKFCGEKIFHYDLGEDEQISYLWFVDEPETRKEVEDYLVRKFGRDHGLKPDYETESLFDKAVAYYSEAASVDINNEFVQKHRDEYIYCYENGKDLIDLDFWCDYQELLGEKITYEEYVAIDEHLDGAPADYTQDNIEIINLLRKKLKEYREVPKGVDELLSDAKERSEGSNPCVEGKVKEGYEYGK